MWTAEHRAAYMREYRAKHRNWIKVTERLWREKYREDINRRARRRYATDPEYRARILAAQRQRRRCTAAVGSAPLADKQTDRRQTDDGA